LACSFVPSTAMTPIGPARTRRRARAPRRTARPTRPRDSGASARSSRDPGAGADHTRGDILDAAALHATRRALPDRVAVEQQCDHHRRVVRRAALTVVAISRVERAQIKRRDGVDHEPRKMSFGQPLARARRQSTAPDRDRTRGTFAPPRHGLHHPGRSRLCATATMRCSSRPEPVAGCSARVSLVILSRREFGTSGDARSGKEQRRVRPRCGVTAAQIRPQRESRGG
jgi:hypothetical protein